MRRGTCSGIGGKRTLTLQWIWHPRTCYTNTHFVLIETQQTSSTDWQVAVWVHLSGCNIVMGRAKPRACPRGGRRCACGTRAVLQRRGFAQMPTEACRFKTSGAQPTGPGRGRGPGVGRAGGGISARVGDPAWRGVSDRAHLRRPRFKNPDIFPESRADGDAGATSARLSHHRSSQRQCFHVHAQVYHTDANAFTHPRTPRQA